MMNNITYISILLFSYTLIVLLIAKINKVRPGIMLYQKLQPGNVKLLNCLHAAAALLMFLPVCVIHPLPVSLLIFPDRISLGQALAFITVVFAMGFFPWTKFKNDHQQEMAGVKLHLSSVIFYVSLRIITLIIYEFFFRGLMLVLFSASLGVEWSIVINILLYTVIHLQKEKKEIIGCIPFGLLLCVFTIWWQSVWPAIIFHLQLATINEWPPLQQSLSPQEQTAL